MCYGESLRGHPKTKTIEDLEAGLEIDATRQKAMAYSALCRIAPEQPFKEAQAHLENAVKFADTDPVKAAREKELGTNASVEAVSLLKSRQSVLVGVISEQDLAALLRMLQ